MIELNFDAVVLAFGGLVWLFCMILSNYLSFWRAGVALGGIDWHLFKTALSSTYLDTLLL